MQPNMGTADLNFGRNTRRAKRKCYRACQRHMKILVELLADGTRRGTTWPLSAFHCSS